MTRAQCGRITSSKENSVAFHVIFFEFITMFVFFLPFICYLHLYIYPVPLINECSLVKQQTWPLMKVDH